jgi:hypothetical protein
VKKAVLNLTGDQFDRFNVSETLLRSQADGFAVGLVLGDAGAPKSPLQLADRSGSEVRNA